MRTGGEVDEAKPDMPVLAAQVAHEINNPLETLVNLLYLLETEATFSAKGRQYLLLAREEVFRLSKIAHQALDQKKVVEMPERADVGKLVAGVLEFYKPRFDSAGISIKTRYSSDVSIKVYPAQLHQAISNLLLNAVDAISGGGTIQARVSVWQEWLGEARHGIRLTIADTGTGMQPSVLSDVLHRSLTTKSTGHGLGLSLVRDVVRNHRGQLRVKSSTKPGRHGTVFTLLIPAI